MAKEIIIVVGDITSYVANYAHVIDADAQLITEDNYQNLKPGVYYISLGDFSSLSNFAQALKQATQLMYCPPKSWSDSDLDGYSYMQHWTEFYLLFNRGRKPVNELIVPADLNSMLKLADHRRTEHAQLWSVGCSITHGVGVDSEQRYGQLLANHLKLPVSFLTAIGSSISWQSDQILRSDIRAGDIVIWGLTSHARFPYYKNQQVEHINISYYQEHPEFTQTIDIDRLDEPNSVYRATVQIAQVVNFCQHIGAKLILAGVFVDHNFINYVAQFPNYLHLMGEFGQDPNELFIDVGSDNKHPGPRMHKYYADQIIQYRL